VALPLRLVPIFTSLMKTDWGKSLKLEEDEGKVIATLDLQETILSTPALAADGLYIRSDKHLWKISQ